MKINELRLTNVIENHFYLDFNWKYEASHLSVSWRENHIFGPETFRDTYGAAHLSVS